MTTLRLILWDQLSLTLSALQGCNVSKDIILMAEVLEDATYVKHHKKKLAFLFSAMRHFAAQLKDEGYQVVYVPLDDPNNTGTLKGEIQRFLKTHTVEKIVVTHPGEYRVLEDVQDWEKAFKIPVEIPQDDRFLCSKEQFEAWIHGVKQPRMEYFYRNMRKQYGILMEDGEKPVGGKWNYDAENRKPPKEGLNVPTPYAATPDAITRKVMELISKRFPDHFGDLEPFYLAVTRDQALKALDLFITQRLKDFGTYQDAMVQGEPWMYHSHLSFYLNCGLLLPLECIQAAEAAYHQGNVPLNAAEGFIRQILGWREYVRGIYWHNMPQYRDENFFEATHPLPDFYWTGETDMNCLRQCIQETLRNAYAHHIQRLMVLGNFALLAGVDPAQVNEWFLIVYADAHEWVELPNVSGMTLFADGGYLASKPYAAGGVYINKMSTYCKSCRYNVSQKEGSDACPFNYLYWDFLSRNRKKLSTNPRLGMMYRTYDQMEDARKQAIARDSAAFLYL